MHLKRWTGFCDAFSMACTANIFITPSQTKKFFDNHKFRWIITHFVTLQKKSKNKKNPTVANSVVCFKRVRCVTKANRHRSFEKCSIHYFVPHMIIRWYCVYGMEWKNEKTTHPSILMDHNKLWHILIKLLRVNIHFTPGIEILPHIQHFCALITAQYLAIAEKTQIKIFIFVNSFEWKNKNMNLFKFFIAKDKLACLLWCFEDLFNFNRNLRKRKFLPIVPHEIGFTFADPCHWPYECWKALIHAVSFENYLCAHFGIHEQFSTQQKWMNLSCEGVSSISH